MIKPINSAMPNFRAIYQSKQNMKPEQIEVTNSIVTMLTSDEFKNKKGKTLEEQAGVKADFYIDPPMFPHRKDSDDKQVNVSLSFMENIDANGQKTGRRKMFSIGNFDKTNVNTFPDKFQGINKQNNTDKLQERLDLAAMIISSAAFIAYLSKDFIQKLISEF